jgi:hypothetical protein
MLGIGLLLKASSSTTTKMAQRSKIRPTASITTATAA